MLAKLEMFHIRSKFRQIQSVDFHPLRLIPTVDNTLTFLHNSAVSRGLSHCVTKNLAFMANERERISKKKYYSPSHWNPNLPFNSPEYKPSRELAIRAFKEARMLAKLKQQNKEMWGAYDEVMRFAEAGSGLMLGREPVRESLESRD